MQLLMATKAYTIAADRENMERGGIEEEEYKFAN